MGRATSYWMGKVLLARMLFAFQQWIFITVAGH
jgi:hypothetical protein